MTIKELINTSAPTLSKTYSLDEAKYIIKLLVADFLKLNKQQLVLASKNEASCELKDYVSFCISKLSENVPFQYILGFENFYGYDFIVNENVLIPRPETEELVEWISQTLEGNSTAHILDIGTGSGCIPITLNKLLPNINIEAVDISAKALETAKQNNLKNNTKVVFLQLDILNENAWNFESKFEVIVSNPPYIPNKEKALMQANVIDFEPHLALFVEDDDALIFYEKIADFSLKYLASNGFLFFECNEFNAQDVKEMLSSKGYVQIELRKDMSGKERMIKASLL